VPFGVGFLNYPSAESYGNITMRENNQNKRSSLFVWVIASLRMLQWKPKICHCPFFWGQTGTKYLHNISKPDFL